MDASGSLEAVQNGLSVVNEETDSFFATADSRFEIKNIEYYGNLAYGKVGSVYRCTLGQSADFAVKIIDTAWISERTGVPHKILVARLSREAEVLRRVAGHPNITALHSMCISLHTLRLFLVTELVPYGNFFNEVAFARRRKPMLEGEARSVAKQLVSAVAHCHGVGVAHQDIKLQNILVSTLSPLQLKLGNFSFADNIEDSALVDPAKTLTTTEGYPLLVAQAMRDNAYYDAFKVDSLGVGICVYTIICNAFPDLRGQAFEAHPRFTQLSYDGRDFVRGMLRQDPQQRLGVVASQMHPFLERGCPSKTHAEVQGLLAVQALVKSLQRQRGASCWVATGSKGRVEYAWRCQCTAQCLELARARLAYLAGECWEHLRAAVERAAADFECWVRRILESGPGELVFEKLFGGCRGALQAVADTLSTAISEVLRRYMTAAPILDGEFQMKLLQLISEQLGRERAFASSHIVWDYTSFAGGLYSGIGVTEEPLFSDMEIADLEKGKLDLFEGKMSTAQWWSLLTDMIDTMHSRLSPGANALLPAVVTILKAPLELVEAKPGYKVDDVEDIHDVEGRVTPLYSKFKCQYWLMLSWRYELHLRAPDHKQSTRRSSTDSTASTCASEAATSATGSPTPSTRTQAAPWSRVQQCWRYIMRVIAR